MGWRLLGQVAGAGAPSTLATMGCGLLYALGAAVAVPGRQVVAVVGDGGFTVLMGKLATMARYGLPTKVIILKNNSLGESK